QHGLIGGQGGVYKGEQHHGEEEHKEGVVDKIKDKIHGEGGEKKKTKEKKKHGDGHEHGHDSSSSDSD
ncbi:cold acclimation responsive protein BudCAR4, partial [Trifolium medium]|nr:cold acclimation responsive protein BudCAR4 [Trifolium medium]